MPFPSRVPVRSRHAPMGIMRIAIGVVIGLSWGAIAGCSSPSRGPEVDIVEVERIEVLPSETAAPEAAGESTISSPASDGAKATAAATGASAADSGDPPRPPAEEVRAAPASN
jgi:hypothetical protein